MNATYVGHVYRFMAGFERSLEATHSRASQKAYIADLETFRLYYEPLHLAMADLTSEHVQTYLAHLEADGRSAATRARRMASLRSFCEHLVAEGVMSDNPARRVKIGKRRIAMAPAPTPAEVRAYANALALGSVDRVVFELAAIGLRAGEIAALKLEDLDLATSTLRVGMAPDDLVGLGAGRTVDFESHTWDALDAYVRRTHGIQRKPWYFLVMGANASSINRQYAWQLVKRATGKAYDPSALRRTRVASLLAEGMTVDYVRSQVGIVDTQQILRYQAAS